MLLVTKDWIGDGRRFLEQLIQRGIEVTAAGWLKFSTDGKWRLYIAVKGIADKGAFGTYGVIQEILQTWSDPWLDLVDIRLIDASKQVALDMKKIQDRIADKVISPAWVAQLGDKSIDEGYIYAPIRADQNASASTPSP